MTGQNTPWRQRQKCKNGQNTTLRQNDQNFIEQVSNLNFDLSEEGNLKS